MNGFVHLNMEDLRTGRVSPLYYEMSDETFTRVDSPSLLQRCSTGSAEDSGKGSSESLSDLSKVNKEDLSNTGNVFLTSHLRLHDEHLDEPLLQDNPNRFVVFPIQHHDMWQVRSV